MSTITESPVQIETVLDSFEELALISSISGNEKAVAEHIKSKLKGFPVQIIEQAATEMGGGNQGNLIIIPDSFDSKKPSAAFLAHLDTVRDTSLSEIVRDSDRIRTAGDTQLGADNRLGITILLEMLFKSLEQAKPANIIYVFTVGEETGMLGAKSLDVSAWNVKQAFVFDSALRPGNYIKRASGMKVFDVVCNGRAAHSAVNPADGISALRVASETIQDLYSSLKNYDVLFNVGTIKGGEATNIIPALCRFEAELRAFDISLLEQVFDKVTLICHRISLKYGAEVVVSEVMNYQPYHLHDDLGVIKILKKSMLAARLKPIPNEYHGGSDANVLNLQGLAAVNLGIGAQNPHSDEEFVLYEDILTDLQIAENIQSHF